MKSFLPELSKLLMTKSLTMRRRREFRSRLWSLCFENLEDRRVMAGEFTDLGNLGITNSLRSSASWGDFDNDGDLDVLVTGFAANDDFARCSAITMAHSSIIRPTSLRQATVRRLGAIMIKTATSTSSSRDVTDRQATRSQRFIATITAASST